jgi:hypothetical protein
VPNVATNSYATSAYKQTLNDNKGALHIDANTNWGLLSSYYFMDNYSLVDPYPVAQGGANVPGFSALNSGRAQLLGIGDTRTFPSNAVNECRFSFLRDANVLGRPLGGLGVGLASPRDGSGASGLESWLADGDGCRCQPMGAA